MTEEAIQQYDEGLLRETGLLWESNRSTKPGQWNEAGGGLRKLIGASDVSKALSLQNIGVHHNYQEH